VDFLHILDDALKGRQFVAGDRFSVADITGLVTLDFMKLARLDVPGACANVMRWHGDISARPSAQA